MTAAPLDTRSVSLTEAQGVQLLAWLWLTRERCLGRPAASQVCWHLGWRLAARVRAPSSRGLSTPRVRWTDRWDGLHSADTSLAEERIAMHMQASAPTSHTNGPLPLPMLL